MTIIQRKNGDRINLNDAGIRTRDFIISSPNPIHNFGGDEDGIGLIDYGTFIGARDIEVHFRAVSRNIDDFSLLRDEIFDIFKVEDSFYLIEHREPGKRWLVKVKDAFNIPQRNVFGDFEITFVALKGFAESSGTSADLETGNMIPYADLTIEGNYQFWTPISDLSFSSLSPVSYEGYDKQFLRVNVPSAEVGNNRRIRTRHNINLVNGKEYKLSFIAATSDWLNSNFNYTGILRTTGSFATNGNLSNRIEKESVGTARIGDFTKTIYKYTATFIHEDVTGNYALMIGTKQTTEQSAYFIITEPSINAGGIGIDDYLWGYGMGLLYDDESMSYTHNAKDSTSFRVYNAGNVPVHPFESNLKMTISNVVGSDSMFQITNLTNSSRARVNVPLSPSDVVVYDGPDVTRNNLAFLRSTRRDFLELSPGWNTLQVYFCESARISFDFPFYYR